MDGSQAHGLHRSPLTSGLHTDLCHQGWPTTASITCTLFHRSRIDTRLPAMCGLTRRTSFACGESQQAWAKTVSSFGQSFEGLTRVV